MAEQALRNVAVVGAGNMGRQIALCAALAGFSVKCTDVSVEILDKAREFAATWTRERVAKGKLAEIQASNALANIAFTTSLEEAAGDADVVIEAILEKLDLKRELFAQLDKVCPPHTILATNSSFIVSSRLADATQRTSKVCNMHFFNPALVMKLVEVVKGAHVSDETAETLMALARDMGKTPVLLHKEINGFLVNRIVKAVNAEALYLYDMGIASFQDIDTAVENGLGYPMGPFKLMDLAGLDFTYYANMERYRDTGDPANKPSPAIVEKFAKNEWGQKTGKGFYEYPKAK